MAAGGRSSRCPTNGVSGLKSWLDRQFMMFTFRMLIKRACPLAEIHHMATEAGWSGAKIETALLGFEAWMSQLQAAPAA